MPPTEAIVLSDLHLGPDAHRAPLHDPGPLQAFFTRLATDRFLPPTELVLNGDVVDFLCCEGYQGLDPQAASQHFSRILAHNKDVLVALKAFVQAKGRGHRLTVLAGNHDPELLLPEIREQLEQALDLRDGILWADDQPLVPATQGRWPIWGRQLGAPDAPLWVLHGDRWDPVNAIQRDALRQAARDGKPFPLPPGSSLVYEVLTPIKLGADGQRPRPWIEQLKPELEAVLPLLLYLDPERTYAYLKKHLGLTSRLLREKVLFQAGQLSPLLGSEASSEDFDHAEGQPEAGEASEVAGDRVCGILAGTLQELSVDQRLLTLHSWCDTMENGLVQPERPTLAEHAGPWRWLARAWCARLQKAPDFLALDAEDDVLRHAQRALPEGLAGLIVGHTHGPRWAEGKPPVYLNTGTWMGVGRIPEGKLDALIDALDAGVDWPVEYPRTFARVSWSKRTPEATLWACDQEGSSHPLSQPKKS